MGIQVGPDGRVTYNDDEGDTGSTWDYLTKHLPNAVGQTFGEALTPSLGAVGGEYNAHDYLLKQLENRGGEGLGEAALKGAGEGLVRTFVPKTGIDLQSNALGIGSGALLEGATAARSVGAAAQAAARSRALAKLQAKAQAGTPTATTARPMGSTTKSPGPGYHTVRAQNAAMTRRGVGEAAKAGPKASKTEYDLWQKGRMDRGRKGGDTPDTFGPLKEPMKASMPSNVKPAPPQSFGEKFRASSTKLTPEEVDALDQLVRQARTKPVSSASGADIAGPEGNQAFSRMRGDATKELTGRMRAEQLEEGVGKMYNEQAEEGLKGLRQPDVPETGDAFSQDLEYEKMLAENPTNARGGPSGAGAPTFTGPQSSWPTDVYNKLRRFLTPEEFTRMTGLGPTGV